MSQISAKACVFDVFGTVLDWEGGLCRQLMTRAETKGIQNGAVDWLSFAHEWVIGHQQRAQAIARGAPGPTHVDALHRLLLDEMLASATWAHISVTFNESERAAMVDMWHGLDAWPDSARGLAKLKKKVMIAPLSNGSTRILVNLARKNDLPWDLIFAADMLGTYKPAPAMYEGAARLLGLPLADVCMVAAHMYDLRAARAFGMKTVYVRRPTEDLDERDLVSAGADGEVDAVVDSLEELADLF